MKDGFFAPVFTGAGSSREQRVGDGDGFPHAREQREMGPRMREDNGWGMGAPLTTLQGRMQLGTGFTPIPRLHEGRL